MLSQLQSSYHQLDQSLTRLADSIAAYNPSTSAADDLVVADEAVNADLETLITHQRNHLRISQLNRILEENDAVLKDHFRRIVNLRKELSTLPSYEHDYVDDYDDGGDGGDHINDNDVDNNDGLRQAQKNGASKAIQVDELLKYAKFISKTTVPPTFRAKNNEKDEGNTAQIVKTEHQTPTNVNGSAHSPAATAAADAPGVAAGVGHGQGQPQNQQQQQQPEDDGQTRQETGSDDQKETNANGNNIGVKTMNAEERGWLDPLAGAAFEPWPSADLIQRGALGDIQRLLDRGVDPADVLSPEEQAEVDRRKKEREAKERAEQEERDRRRMSMFDVGRRGNTLAQDDVFDPDA